MDSTRCLRGNAVCALIVFFCNALLAQEAGSLRGRVTDARTGEGLAEAIITLSDASWRGISDEGGNFATGELDAGVYEISVQLLGYRSIKGRQVEVVRGMASDVKLALERRPIVFEELIVAAEREPLAQSITITDRQISERKPKDIGEFLRATPGLAAIRKGGTALDLVYRGFRMDQLNVQIDGGVQVNGACPNRMDPPTSHVQAEDLEKIEIIRGPHAVRYGASFGGLVNLAMNRPRQTDRFELRTRFESGYESNGSGKRVRGLVFGSDRTYDFFLSAGSKEYGDYSDGDGEEVESGFQVRDYSVKLGWKPDADQRLQLSGRQAFLRDALYPALPMDADVDDTGILAVDYSRRMRQGRLNRLSAKVYASTVEHVMTNQRKPDYAQVHAETDADTRTVGGRLEAEMKELEGNLFLGADYRDLFIEGFRTREMMAGSMAGSTLRDIIWPDAHHRKFGVFGEFERMLSVRTAFSLGLRLERVTTDAGHPEASFAALYDADLERAELIPSVSLSLIRQVSRRLDVEFSAGLSRRAPSVSERYLYLLPTGLDAYDYLGDPGVDPEQNLQFDLGVGYRAGRGYLNAAVFYAQLGDYISARLDTTVASRSPGAPGVKRFFNIDRAGKFGGEAEAGFRVRPELLIRGQLAYIRGENADSGQPLPEMPPLEGTLAIRYDDREGRIWTELAERLVARQERIAAEFGETETPGFAVTDLVVGARVGDAVELTGGIDNILDETYHEHLNRRDKVGGGPLNEAGRSFYLMLKLVR